MLKLANLKHYAELIRLNRPIGTYLLLWPTLWGLWFSAQGIPDLKILIIFILGVVLMRSAGCAINDYADRDIDLLVARTKDRPLTSGKISSKEALSVFGRFSLDFFLLGFTAQHQHHFIINCCGNSCDKLPLYEALSSLSSSAFRRSIRLGNPYGIHGNQ